MPGVPDDRGHVALLLAQSSARQEDLQVHPQGAPSLPGTLRHGG